MHLLVMATFVLSESLRRQAVCITALDARVRSSFSPEKIVGGAKALILTDAFLLLGVVLRC